MKKSIFLSVAAILFSIASFAQQPMNMKPEGNFHAIPSAEQIAQRRADRLQQQLRLNKDQYKKVYKLYLKQAKNDMARINKQQIQKAKIAQEMRAILNNSQYELFIQIQNAPRKGKFHNQRPPMPPQPKCNHQGKCPNAKPCGNKPCNEAPKPGNNVGGSVKGPDANKDLQKGDRIRVSGDPRRNQNAYNYVEGAPRR